MNKFGLTGEILNNIINACKDNQKIQLERAGVSIYQR